MEEIDEGVGGREEEGRREDKIKSKAICTNHNNFYLVGGYSPGQ